MASSSTRVASGPPEMWTEILRTNREPLKKSIHLWLNVSLVLTVGLIAVSVGVLAVTPRVTNISGLPQIVLAAGCVWLMACLIAFAWLIRKTLA